MLSSGRKKTGGKPPRGRLVPAGNTQAAPASEDADADETEPHGGEIGARRIDPSQLKEDGLCPIGQGDLCGQEGQTTTANGERGRHARLIKRACGWGDTGVHSPQLLP